MTHDLGNNVSVLRRWEANGGGQLPDNWHQFQRDNMMLSIKISEEDPELVALISGTASAGLRADALSGKFSAVPPDYQQIQRQLAFDRQQELSIKIEAGKSTFTERLELGAINPGLLAQLEAKNAPSAEQVALEKARKQAAQQEALAASRQHTARQAFAEYQAKSGDW